MSTVNLNINPYFSSFLHPHDEWKESDTNELNNNELNNNESDDKIQEKLPLGLILQKASLVSSTEIGIALEDQMQSQGSLRIGEILAQKGWIKQKTADFFALKWDDMIEKVQTGEAKYKLGESLREAGLISDEQLLELLELQKQENLIFGELIIQKGFLKRNTVNLFIESLGFYQSKSFDLQAQETLQSVRKLVFVRDYPLAILELRKALKSHPHHCGLHALLSIVFTKTKQIPMAKVHLHKAQRMNTQDPLVIEAANLLKLYENTWSFNTTSLNDKFESHSAQVESKPSAKKSIHKNFKPKKLNIFQKTMSGIKKVLSISLIEISI
jgi:hypothetical protein